MAPNSRVTKYPSDSKAFVQQKGETVAKGEFDFTRGCQIGQLIFFKRLPNLIKGRANLFVRFLHVNYLPFRRATLKGHAVAPSKS